MLLIIEIALAIAAWKRGAGALALIPVGLAMAAGFCVGLTMPDIEPEALLIAALTIDGAAIAALVIMTVRGVKRIEPMPTN